LLLVDLENPDPGLSRLVTTSPDQEIKKKSRSRLDGLEAEE
jgi:hypothetical protein